MGFDTKRTWPAGWRVPLVLAGLHDCGLAGYHFFLPHHMQWERGTVTLADSLAWALFALNFSWSLLVLIVGLLVIYAAFAGPDAGLSVRVTVFAVGLFWAVHGVYMTINPFPLPASLLWLRVLLGAFPFIAVILHWLPLILVRSEAGMRASRTSA